MFAKKFRVSLTRPAMPAADANQGGGSGGATLAQYRETVKRTVVSIRWEMGMLIFVLFYFVVVFLTFAFEDQKVGACPITRECSASMARPTPMSAPSLVLADCSAVVWRLDHSDL